MPPAEFVVNDEKSKGGFFLFSSSIIEMMSYYDIIPLQKITTKDSLTYQAPEDCYYVAGQLVFIPLGNKTIAGIVLSGAKKPNFPTKEIIGVFDLRPLLSPEQLLFCKKLAQEQLTTPGEILYQLLPGKFRNPTKTLIKNAFLPKLHTSPPQLTIKSKFTINFLSQTDPDEKFRTIKKLIRSKQTLILTSDLSNYLSNKLKTLKDLLVLDTSSSKKEWQSWTTIYTAQPQLVLGSHKSFFLPLKELKQIILTEDTHQFLKFQQKPFHNLRDSAILLAKISSVPVYILDANPSIPTLAAIRKYQQKLPLLKTSGADIEIVSSPVEEISYQVEKLIEQDKKIAVIYFKKGIASALLCSDCSRTIKCPNCQSSLYVKNPNTLSCKICDVDLPFPEKCPICKGINLKNLGSGIEKLKKIHKKPKLIFGTPDILDNLGENFEVIILIDPETWLSFPDFAATEKLFLWLKKASLRTHKLVIQTKNPRISIWKSLKKPSTEFLRQELLNRKRFNLPPFTRQIQIKISHSDEKKLDLIVQKSVRILDELKKSPGIQIFPPQKTYYYKVKNRFSKQIIVNSSKESFRKVAQLLSSLKRAEVKVIVDPENLLS